MPTYILRDENGYTESIEADDLLEAQAEAEDWVKDGGFHFEDGDESVFFDVTIEDEDGETLTNLTVTIDPDEPECFHSDGHNYQQPFEIVGGCSQNPGVHGHGGGVIISEVCIRCGTSKVTDTWAQHKGNGRQGFESVAYEKGKHLSDVTVKVVLTSYSLNGTEEYYNRWCFFVEEHLEKESEYPVSLDWKRYGESGVTKITGPDTGIKLVKDLLEELWYRFDWEKDQYMKIKINV
jgi:hypothetical protein